MGPVLRARLVPRATECSDVARTAAEATRPVRRKSATATRRAALVQLYFDVVALVLLQSKETTWWS